MAYVQIPLGGGDPPRPMTGEEVYRRVEMSVNGEMERLRRQPATRARDQSMLRLRRSLDFARGRRHQVPATPTQTPQDYFQQRGQEAIAAEGNRRLLDLGGDLGGAAGAIAGQALIPIPGVGGMIGQTVGKTVGSLYQKGLGSDNKLVRGLTGMALGGPAGAALALALGGGEDKPNVAKTRASKGIYRKGGKIKYRGGGSAHSIGQDAVQFVGPKHEQGGIPIPGTDAEVEGGETMDRVNGSQYVFSDSLKVPGTKMTFAQFHKKMVQMGASEREVNHLAALNDRTRGAKGDPNKLDFGGFMQGVGGWLKGAGQSGIDLVRETDWASATPYAGDLMNIGMGLFGGTNVPEAARVSDNAANSLRKQRVNVQSYADQIHASTRGITTNNNASTADKLGAHVQEINQLAQLGAQAETMNQANITAGLQGMQDVASQNARLLESHRQDTQAAQAAKERMLTEGMAGIARTHQGLERDRRMGEMDVFKAMAGMAGMDPTEHQAYITQIREFVPQEYREAFDRAIRQGDYEAARRIASNPAAPPIVIPGASMSPLR